MKKVFGLLASLTIAGSAQAVVVTYDFTVRVDTVNHCVTEIGCMYPSTVNMWGGEVTYGDIGRGRISFDTETPKAEARWQPSAPVRGTQIVYQDAAARNDSFLRVGDAGAVFQQTAPDYTFQPRIEVGNDLRTAWDPSEWDPSNRDHFNFQAVQNTYSYDSQSLEIDLSDASGTALTGGGIPLRLDSFGDRRFSFKSGNPDDYSYVRGSITSLTLAAPVPEPETYAMLLAGLGMLAWRRKRAGARAA